MTLYKGYIPTKGKQAIMTFKGKSSSELMSLEEVSRLNEYAGILADDTILIDIDTEEETAIMLNIVQSLNLNCRVVKSRSGGHFLFKTDVPRPNRTKVNLAVGLTADIKGCGKASYEMLKIEGREHPILYDNPPYQVVPKYLSPIKTNVKLLNLAEGEGRNNALFSYILPLQQNDFTTEECRECIRVINEFILAEPLSDDELNIILRDGAFSKPTFFTSRGVFLFDKFANYLKRAENIIKINGKLYIYRNGIYEQGDSHIEAAMIKHIPNLGKAKRQEVLSYLALIVNEESFVQDANLIAFNNGVLNVITEDFVDFSPEYIITNRIPHNYLPSATNELLDKTMGKLSCGDENVLKLLYESIGYCFYRRNELRKSFFLLGEKRNGKSTFLDLVGTLLGEANTSNLDLCEIGDRFRTAELSEKLANIGDDINDEYISNTAIFKKVVSGDVITAERKGKDPFKLRSYSKFFFSANSLPRLGRGKDSSAVLDRLVIIPFDAKFSKTDPDYDPFIKYKLRDESVMEALIAKAIPALREVLANQEFTQCSKVDSNLVEYERINNPILEFFEDLDESDYIHEPVKEVYRRYSAFCCDNNMKAIAALEFQQQVKKHFGLAIKQIQMGDKRVRVYEYEQE